MKPNIEDVFAAFQRFQNRTVIATNRLWSEPVKFREEMADAQDEFKQKMLEFGLADRIDWTDKSK